MTYADVAFAKDVYGELLNVGRGNPGRSEPGVDLICSKVNRLDGF